MNLKAKEISIRYDERIGETKLNPFSDGFLILQKILTFMFVFNPKYSFVYPGLFFFCFSMLLFSILAFSPINLGNLRLDIHSLIFSCMAAIVGFQIMTFGLISKLYATTYKNIPADGFVNFIIKKKIWKAAAVVGMGFTLVGTFIIVQIFYLWIKSGFHPIMKLNSSIIALFLFIMGILIIFSSLFLSIFAKDIINREKQFNYYDQFQKIKGVEL